MDRSWNGLVEEYERMDFRLLGPFEAWHGDVQVDLGDLQQRHVLAVLLLNANKPVAGERLIEIIWGENRPRSNLVIGYVAKIRRMFRDAGAEDVTIRTTPTGYVLQLDTEMLDTVRFTALCDQAAAAKRGGDTARAVRLLHDAVDLWRGEYLEDLDIDRLGGPAVAMPDEALPDAVCDLADLELAAGNHRWVRNRLRPLVHTHPTHQRLAAALMRGLLANDDQVQAMNVYHLVKDALDDYGLTPSTELRAQARVAQYGVPRSTLPPRLSRFTGRTRELSEIEALTAGTSPVVWLSGPPGIGKTTLAVQAAHLLRERFTDARLFVPLNGFTPNVRPVTPIEALGTLLVDLGVPAEQVPPTLNGRMARYQAEIAGTRTLVVLDNANSEEQVQELLPDAPGCMAIVTSRKVSDLERADNLRLEPMPDKDAVALFQDLVGQNRLRGRSNQIMDVVARCGLFPLQITVVASQFRRHDRWRLTDLLQMLDDTRPDDVGAACTVSYTQLDERQQTLFRLIGHLPGHDLSAHGAAALVDCDLRQARALLEHLHGVCLIEETRPNRYHMLDPLKNFATTVATVPHRAALGRLLDFYLLSTAAAITVAFPFDGNLPVVEVAPQATPTFHDHQQAMGWLTDELPNLVACIRYAAEHDRPDHTWRLAVLPWRYFLTTGRLRDLVEALELARKVTDDPYGHAQVLLRLATARWRAGDLDAALELATSALPRLVELGDVQGVADGLSGIALVAIDQGDHYKAMTHFEAALTKYEELGNRAGQAHVLSHMGHLNEMHNQFELAEEQHLAAVSHLRAIDHRAGLANALDNLGSVRQRLGRLDQALADHQEASTLAADVGDRTAAAYALNNIGNVHRVLGKLTDAVHHHELAAAANPDPDPPLGIQLALDRAATRLAGGDPGGARQDLKAALTLATKIGDRGQRARANHGLARTAHSIGDHEQAAGHWRAAAAEFAELELPEAEEIRAELRTFRCACGRAEPDQLATLGDPAQP